MVNMVKTACKKGTESLFITQLTCHLQFFSNIGYNQDGMQVVLIHQSGDTSKHFGLANTFMEAELIKRAADIHPDRPVCAKAPLGFIRGGKDFPVSSAIERFKLWDLEISFQTGKPRQLSTVHVYLLDENETSSSSQKSRHQALILGKSEEGYAPTEGTALAWIILV